MKQMLKRIMMFQCCFIDIWYSWDWFTCKVFLRHRNFWRTTRVVFLSISLTACSYHPSGYEKGIAAFRNQDFHIAFVRLKPFANAGNPEAEYALGYMYFYGQGVLESKEQALAWFTRSASQNYPLAIQALNLIRSQQQNLQ